ncbi:Hypothetical_protein [Hexamita inflata]|uniref:Hypothetical_protein n=1 Tax=Hexamita inflata TaxID=28002 RepID=A0AA86QTU6_9EUKA|nr:Hypothetical protein HINF_LOCUS46839 [Hexamita inflata]
MTIRICHYFVVSFLIVIKLYRYSIPIVCLLLLVIKPTQVQQNSRSTFASERGITWHILTNSRAFLAQTSFHNNQLMFMIDCDPHLMFTFHLEKLQQMFHRGSLARFTFCSVIQDQTSIILNKVILYNRMKLQNIV